MKKTILYRKVAFDLFYEQLKWSAWFLAIIVGVSLAIRYFLPGAAGIGGFLLFSRSSAGVFMLVLGIMSAYGFMQYYVQQGISRKNMYKGIALAAAGLSLIITSAALVVNVIEYFFAQQFMTPAASSSVMIDGNWLAEAGIYALSIYVYFLVGWMISIGYYRFGWFIGLGFIALAIVAISLHDYFWGGGLTNVVPWLPAVTAKAVPFVGAMGTIVLIAALLFFIYSLTKRVAIKM